MLVNNIFLKKEINFCMFLFYLFLWCFIFINKVYAEGRPVSIEPVFLSETILPAAVTGKNIIGIVDNNTMVINKKTQSASHSSSVTNSTDNFIKESINIKDSDNVFVEDTKLIADSLRVYNHWMFGINMALDTNLFRPVTHMYVNNSPKVIQSSASNFYRNLKEPWVAVNLLLQGRVLSSLESLSRFGINSVTTLGFADPAGNVFHLTRYKEDFGQTLGSWGVPSGAYVVLPLFGPSTIRDAGGRFLDSYANPISHTPKITEKLALLSGYGLTKRAKIMKYEGIIEPTYEVVRDAYLQKRQFDVDNIEFREDTSDSMENSGFDESFGD